MSMSKILKLVSVTSGALKAHHVCFYVTSGIFLHVIVIQVAHGSGHGWSRLNNRPMSWRHVSKLLCKNKMQPCICYSSGSREWSRSEQA